MGSRADIERRVRELGEQQPWWQDIELPDGVWTIGRDPGELRLNHNRVKWGKLAPWLDLSGRDVVDVGCGEGFYCLEALKRGARQVTGVDINRYRIEKARWVAQTLGQGGVKYLCRSALEVSRDDLGGECDLVLALGLLHRVPNPYGLVERCADLGRTTVFEWQVLDSDEPMAAFWGGGYKEYDRDNTGYWMLSRRCLKDILRRVGFSAYLEIESEDERAIVAAGRVTEGGPVTGPWKSLP